MNCIFHQDYYRNIKVLFYLPFYFLRCIFDKIMRRIIAFILILVFISSTTATLFQQISFAKASIELSDSDDATDSEEISKVPNFAKDKLILLNYTFSYSSKSTQEFYLSHQYFLPNPMAQVEIIPPKYI